MEDFGGRTFDKNQKLFTYQDTPGEESWLVDLCMLHPQQLQINVDSYNIDQCPQLDVSVSGPWPLKSIPSFNCEPTLIKREA
eukprot:8103873-Pyramimonas_sp.AAC.1